MNTDWFSLSTYLLWELSLFLLAYTLCRRFFTDEGRGAETDERRNAGFVVCALTVKLLLGAVIPHTAIFFGD